MNLNINLKNILISIIIIEYKLEKYIDFYNNYRIKANGLTPMQEKQIYLVAQSNFFG